METEIVFKMKLSILFNKTVINFYRRNVKELGELKLMKIVLLNRNRKQIGMQIEITDRWMTVTAQVVNVTSCIIKHMIYSRSRHSSLPHCPL